MRWQDLILDQPFDATRPSIVRPHSEAGERIGDEGSGFRVADDNLKRVFRAIDPGEDAGHRLIGAELLRKLRFAAIAVAEATSATAPLASMTL